MTLTQVMLEKPVSEIKGKVFKIVANNAGHGFSIGEKVKCDNKDGRYITVKNEAGTIRNNVYKEDLEYYITDKKDVEVMRAEAAKRAAELDEFMLFLTETSSNTMDDKAYKVWKILKIIENEDKEAVKKELYVLLSN